MFSFIPSGKSRFEIKYLIFVSVTSPTEEVLQRSPMMEVSADF